MRYPAISTDACLDELIKIGEEAERKTRRFPPALKNALLGAAGVGLGAGAGELLINSLPQFFSEKTPGRVKAVQFAAPMIAGAIMYAQSKKRKAELERGE